MNDHRNNTRIKHKADIQFENYDSGIHSKARMYNYSMEGMYFETDYAPLPGTEIYIGIKKSPNLKPQVEMHKREYTVYTQDYSLVRQLHIFYISLFSLFFTPLTSRIQ